MRWIAAVVLGLLVASARPVNACSPDWDWCGYERYDEYWDLPAYQEPPTQWWDEPEVGPIYELIYEPIPVYVPEPVHEAFVEPTPAFEPPPIREPSPVYDLPTREEPAALAREWSDPVVWSAPGSDLLDTREPPMPEPAPTPVAVTLDPEAERITLGLHWVADAWTGHLVTTEGPVTTFTTSSVALETGTAARLVARVGTGENSGYDPLLYGGRMALSDGRLVKGDVYANYVWTGFDWVLDRYVFFQDDLEIARLGQIPAEPIPTSVLPPDPPPSVPAPPAVTAPIPVTPPPAFVAPLTGDVPSTPVSSPPPNETSRPVPREVRAGIALAPQADPLGRVEVLRGRPVPLWVRATIDGIPARVVSWQLSSGDLIALGPVSGSGDEPLVATWRSITAPGMTFTVRVRATVDIPGEGPRAVDAAIDVTVRAPALVD